MNLTKILPFCLTLFAAAPTAWAQIGTLDPSFGTGGLVTTDVGSGTYDDAFAVLLQPDGKILAAGTSGYEDVQDLAVVRYLADGTLDPNFGTAGKTTVSIAYGNDIGTCIALQPDGKILVGGYSYLDEISFVLTRLNADGTLDTGFGANGLVNTDIDGNTSIGKGLAVQADGKILFAGGGLGGFALVRYDSDGTLDPTFGTAGLALCPFAGSSAQANAIALQSDGLIVLAGYASGKSGDAIAVARFDADGVLDPAFGTDGTVQATWPGAGGTGSALAIAEDGEITVVGAASNLAVVARFTSAGVLDPVFYGTGIRQLTMTGVTMSNAYAVAVQYDGRPIIAGVVSHATNDFMITRMENNGNYDLTFGPEGTVSTDFANNLDIGRAIAVQPNGSIIVAGATINVTQDRNFALARYIGDMSTGVTAVATASTAANVWPDPISNTSRVDFTLATSDKVTIDLLDASGRMVRQLGHARQFSAGHQSVELHIDAALPSGAYVVRVRGSATLLHVNVLK